jgi:hypothetical protein
MREQSSGPESHYGLVASKEMGPPSYGNLRTVFFQPLGQRYSPDEGQIQLTL